MKAKQLIILACVAAALAAVAVLTSDKESASGKTAFSPELIFKDIPVNDITRIEIIEPGQTIRIARKDGRWVAVDKFDYPVKFDRLKRGLIGLTELEAVDKRELNDEQRARVRMISPLDKDAPKEAKGTLTRFFTSGSEPIASLLIGASRNIESSTPGAGAGGTFISPDKGETVLITPQYVGYLEKASPSVWFNNEILRVNSYNVTNITIDAYDEKPLTLYKNEEGDFTMEKIPRRKTLDENKVRSVKSAVSYLRFAEVADPALSDEDMGFDKPSTYTAITSGSEKYTVTLGGKVEGSNDRYLRAKAELTGELPEVDQESEDRQTRGPAGKEKETLQRIESVNEKLKGWTYVVSASNVEPMLFSRDDLLKEKED